MLDGELVVPRAVDGRTRLDWDSLSQRIHPAASRVAMLAEQTPAQVSRSTCLALGDDDLTGRPLRERRAALETARSARRRARPVHLSRRRRTDAAVARGWFADVRGGGPGRRGRQAAGRPVPARTSATWSRSSTTGRRTASSIGYRQHKSVDGVGSLLLGLCTAATRHAHGRRGVGVHHGRAQASCWTSSRRTGSARTSRHAGEPNRWNAREDHSFVPLRPELVVEVEYDQMEGDRLRHAGRVLRWRTDKAPAAVHVRPARGAGPLRPRGRAGPMSPSSPAEELDVAGIPVRLTNPDKVYFPAAGRGGGTKRHLVEYYRAIATLPTALPARDARCATGRPTCSASRTGSRARRSTRSGCRRRCRTTCSRAG